MNALPPPPNGCRDICGDCAVLRSPLLSFLSSTRFVAQLKEEPFPQDPTSNRSDIVPTFTGYSPSGNVTAETVRMCHTAPTPPLALPPVFWAVAAHSSIVSHRFTPTLAPMKTLPSSRFVGCRERRQKVAAAAAAAVVVVVEEGGGGGGRRRRKKKKNGCG